jgi:hypothetical protein
MGFDARAPARGGDDFSEFDRLRFCAKLRCAARDFHALFRRERKDGLGGCLGDRAKTAHADRVRYRERHANAHGLFRDSMFYSADDPAGYPRKMIRRWRYLDDAATRADFACAIQT